MPSDAYIRTPHAPSSGMVSDTSIFPLAMMCPVLMV